MVRSTSENESAAPATPVPMPSALIVQYATDLNRATPTARVKVDDVATAPTGEVRAVRPTPPDSYVSPQRRRRKHDCP